MKRLDFTFLALIFSVVGAAAQVQKVQNKPYIDLRPFHFGILVGTHLQDIELQNVCSQLITGDDGKLLRLLSIPIKTVGMLVSPWEWRESCG